MLIWSGNRSIKRRLYLTIVIALITVRPFASAATVDIPPLLSLFETKTDKTIKKGGIAFDIDKRAVILLKLPHIANVMFDYEADGYFRLNYTTVKEGGYRVANHLLMARSLMKGKGHLDLDLRYTANWSPESYPLLIVEGTGQFLIKNIKATAISDPSVYRTEKNRAFFWRPEVVRVTTVNFLTPVYWDFTRNIHWPAVLGGLFLITVSGILVLKYFRKFPVEKYLPAVSIIFILVYSIHFVIKFTPVINAAPFLSSNEKVRKYSLRPEFGQLLAAAREMVKPDDRVVFAGEERDWLSPEATCFNLAPTKCVFYSPDSNEYAGIGKATKLKASEINVVVSYNSSYELPPGFVKKYELNKNAYIAVRE